MIIDEFKVNDKDSHYRAIDEAIKTFQFLPNKSRRYGMDNQDLSK